MTSIRQFQLEAERRIRRATPFARLSVGAALAAALACGSLGVAQTAIAGKPKQERVAAKGVQTAEKAVARSPRDAALRVALGHAYLEAGRFESAIQAFNDALSLGEASGSTVLSLALAQAAAGDSQRALATLDQWREQIPASDFGLALSLAGQPDRGASLLEDTIRGGENTAKARQNLAYSYALAGRWREARLMAMQDVPPQLIDQRISDWAMQAQPEAYRKRVASLLSVPLREDQGQPAALALSIVPAQASLAEAAPTVPAGELPAMAAASPESAQPAASEPDSFAEAQPVAAPAAAPNPEFQAAFAQTVEASQPQFVSNPIIQAIAPTYAEARPQLRTPVAPRQVARTGSFTHLVQLGSFSSEARARQAWAIYSRQNPQLKRYSLTITPAVVRGRNYWRVAASGFDARGASSMCSSVKGRGGACFAYAATRTLPGAVPSREGNAPRMARR